MSALVLAEHSDKKLNPATLAAISAAQALGTDVDVLVAGSDCGAVAETVAAVDGISKVLLAESDTYAHPLAEDITPLIVQLARGYSHVLAPATTTGKNIMPRVAALLDVAQISDIIGVESADTFLRPIYAGNVIATVRSSDPIKVITVRATAFGPAVSQGKSVNIESVNATERAGLSTFVRADFTESDRPELTSAEIVVSGGRGMGNADNFKLLFQIADKLGAAIGASRAAVDAGFVPNDYQVGQTGKVVAPKLYIAVGISGAIQHLAGMKDSKVIVAINKDEEAPIFQVADYGIVGDLFEVLPQLSAELDKLHS
ncbi:MAG: FAD-binding protein [Gammaproteobacteria bacterium]|nr:FAD-binding protein [Gammaproteobacteria bacterium]